MSSSYTSVQKQVATAKRHPQAKATTKSGKKDNPKKYRALNGRMFPKASLRSFAVKYGAKRLASTEVNGVYDVIDKKLYNVIENVVHDAIQYTTSAGQVTIKESDVVKAIERLGGSVLGLGTEVSRR